jgi:hypothetical protein
LTNFSDLNIIESKSDLEEILTDNDFGRDVEQRGSKLTEARKVAKILNWTGGIVAAWTVFITKPYELSVIAAIIMPIICLFAIKKYKGLIRIDHEKNSAYPTLFYGLIYSGLGVFLRALLDFNIFDYSNIWTPSILIAIAFLAFLIIGNKEFDIKKRKNYLTIAILGGFFFIYGFGSVIFANCIYDKSEPIIYNAKIIEKRISSGKSTTYYLKLTPWGTQKESDEVSVNRKEYEQAKINAPVEVYFMKGKLDIPWFEIYL